MNRGDVWWCTAPGLGTRPVLILTRSPSIALLDPLVVAPLTTTIRDIPTEVILETSDGVPRRSAVALDNVQIVYKRFFRARITRLSDSRMDEVREALRFSVAC